MYRLWKKTREKLKLLYHLHKINAVIDAWPYRISKRLYTKFNIFLDQFEVYDMFVPFHAFEKCFLPSKNERFVAFSSWTKPNPKHMIIELDYFRCDDTVQELQMLHIDANNDLIVGSPVQLRFNAKASTIYNVIGLWGDLYKWVPALFLLNSCNKSSASIIITKPSKIQERNNKSSILF